jgi:hypothetical protein
MTGHRVLLALLLLQLTYLSAQTSDNQVEIQVADQFGAVIPDALIEVAGSQGGALFSTRTGADGKATLDLPRGEFDAVIQSQGFCPQKRTLNVDGRPKTIRAELKLDSCPGPCQAACITVTPVAGTAVLSRSTVSHSISQPALKFIVEDQTGVHLSLARIRVFTEKDGFIEEIVANKFGEATVSLVPGPYIFQVDQPGFWHWVTKTTVAAGSDGLIRAELRSGAVGNAPLVADITQPLMIEHLASGKELQIIRPELLMLTARKLHVAGPNPNSP